MPELTQLERALRILQRLMTHKRVTVKELFDLFDRRESIRTIQRTLNYIQSANIPLEVGYGPHGEHYYSLHRAFNYIPLALSADEIIAALLLGNFAEYFDGTKIGKDIEEVFKKIDQLVPPGSISVSTAFSGISDTLYYSEPGKLNIKPKGQVLTNIFEAIIERKVCQVNYRSYPEQSIKKYQVNPYSLLFHSGMIYGIVFQPYYKDWIYLALQRIEKVKVLDEVFERDTKFNLKEYLKGNFGVWRQKPEKVKIKFSKDVANSLEGRIWHPSQDIRRQKNGDLVLEMKVGLSFELEAWILRWGEFAKVITPKELKETVKGRLAKASEHYGD